MRPVKADCRFYLGSRPCDPHKATGTVCAGCAFYEPVSERIAVVKLGAMGDVLRTMALLPDIASQHKNPSVTWITQPESVSVLSGNPLVSEVVTPDRFAELALTREFDCVYGFENSVQGVSISDGLRAKEYRGFKRGASGKAEGVWDGGDPTLFEIGLWDDLKKQNRRSYLEMLGAAAGVRYSGSRPALVLTETERGSARQAVQGLPRPLIGFNTDAGTRWLRKQWNLEYVIEAVRDLTERGYGVALFGGSNLEGFNQRLAAEYPASVRAFSTSSNVRELFALVGEVDLLVTGDTLAMHAAWALSRPTVALFGPTSLPEIDLGADDIKLASEDLECLGCYLHTCSVSPHCMDRLTPQLVVDAILRRLAAAEACR